MSTNENPKPQTSSEEKTQTQTQFAEKPATSSLDELLQKATGIQPEKQEITVVDETKTSADENQVADVLPAEELSEIPPGAVFEDVELAEEDPEPEPKKKSKLGLMVGLAAAIAALAYFFLPSGAPVSTADVAGAPQVQTPTGSDAAGAQASPSAQGPNVIDIASSVDIAPVSGELFSEAEIINMRLPVDQMTCDADALSAYDRMVCQIEGPQKFFECTGGTGRVWNNSIAGCERVQKSPSAKFYLGQLPLAEDAPIMTHAMHVAINKGSDSMIAAALDKSYQDVAQRFADIASENYYKGQASLRGAGFYPEMGELDVALIAHRDFLPNRSDIKKLEGHIAQLESENQSVLALGLTKSAAMYIINGYCPIDTKDGVDIAQGSFDRGQQSAQKARIQSGKFDLNVDGCAINKRATSANFMTMDKPDFVRGGSIRSKAKNAAADRYQLGSEASIRYINAIRAEVEKVKADAKAAERFALFQDLNSTSDWSYVAGMPSLGYKSYGRTDVGEGKAIQDGSISAKVGRARGFDGQDQLGAPAMSNWSKFNSASTVEQLSGSPYACTDFRRVDLYNKDARSKRVDFSAEQKSFVNAFISKQNPDVVRACVTAREWSEKRILAVRFASLDQVNATKDQLALVSLVERIGAPEQSVIEKNGVLAIHQVAGNIASSVPMSIKGVHIVNVRNMFEGGGQVVATPGGQAISPDNADVFDFVGGASR